MAIVYHSEGVKSPSIKKRVISKWIKEVASTYGKKVKDISYLFSNDDKILEINREYLDHDYYTDIITFDYCEGDVISGDIIISLETVLSNSEKYGKEYSDELMRVIIHGILHLCGIKDKSDEDATIMRKAEDDSLVLLHNLLKEIK